jgi:hypothetical protein
VLGIAHYRQRKSGVAFSEGIAAPNAQRYLYNTTLGDPGPSGVSTWISATTRYWKAGA